MKKIKKILFLLISLLYIENAEAETCASRSFVATSRVEYKALFGWSVSAKKTLAVVDCRAQKKVGNREFTVLYSPKQKYRGKKWYIEITSKEHQLFRGVEEIEAILFEEGASQVLKGKILSVGDWKGKKRISSYIRAEFLADDLVFVGGAKKIKVHSETKPPTEINVEELGPVIKVLKDCMQKATGESSGGFWKNSQNSCG